MHPRRTPSLQVHKVPPLKCPNGGVNTRGAAHTWSTSRLALIAPFSRALTLLMSLLYILPHVLYITHSPTPARTRGSGHGPLLGVVYSWRYGSGYADTPCPLRLHTVCAINVNSDYYSKCFVKCNFKKIRYLVSFFAVAVCLGRFLCHPGCHNQKKKVKDQKYVSKQASGGKT